MQTTSCRVYHVPLPPCPYDDRTMHASLSRYQYFVINTSILVEIIYQNRYIRVKVYVYNDIFYLLYRERCEFLKMIPFHIGFAKWNPLQNQSPTLPRLVLNIYTKYLH